jgi:dihydrofolate reductase
VSEVVVFTSPTLDGVMQAPALLQGDAADAVAALKRQQDKDMVVLGSGELVRSLMERDLVDRHVLLIHPLVPGSGRRLFRDGGPPARPRLVDARTTTTGVVIAFYQKER